jgi:uncharacterized membrane protein (Fun14 family)
MARKNLLKTLTAFLLIAVFFIQSSSQIFATFNDYNRANDLLVDPSIWVAEVLAIQEEMLREVEEQQANFDILHSNFSAPLVDFEKPELVFGMTIEAFEALGYEEQREIIGLDQLTERIMDYYQRYGYLPTMEQFVAHPARARELTFISPEESVGVFRAMGFNVPAFEVSRAAAGIGGLVGVFVPVIQVIALVVGATIVAVAGLALVGEILNIRRFEISNILATMVNSSAWDRRVAENAASQTAAFANARNSGWRHFAARAINTPGGGILISPVGITNEQAIGLLSTTTLNSHTFSITRGDAGVVARAAASRAGGIALHHNAHTGGGRYPLNRPHYNVVHPRNAIFPDGFNAHAWY